MRVLPAHVHIACVVPALRRIFQPVDRAYRESLALDNCVGITARGQSGSVYKGKGFERAPWANGSRSRWGVVDQVSPLKVKSARAQVADRERCVGAEALLQLAVPLLDVLRRRIGIERREANSGRLQRTVSQHRRGEVQATIE